MRASKNIFAQRTPGSLGVRRLSFFSLGILSMFFTGCAPAAAPERLIPAGVASKDLLAVRLANEAMGYSNQGRLIDAALKFHQALYLSPHAKNLQRSLASTYERLGLPEEATNLYQSLSKDAPSDPSLTAGSALAEIRRAAYQPAYSLLEKSLWQFVDKGDWSGAANQAQSISALAFRLGDEEKALCFSELSVHLAPSPARQLRRIRLLTAQGRIKAARKELASAMSDTFFRTDSDALLAQALLFFAEGTYSSAAEAAQRGLLTNPQDSIDKLELSLVRDVSRIEAGVPPDNDDEREARDTQLGEAEDLLSTRGLYWPKSFLLAIEKAIDDAKGRI
jgi:Tfp pilus assembly protein PilF